MLCVSFHIVFPVSIIVRPMLLFTDLFSTLMYSFLIVAFSGSDLALLAQPSCLDFILSMKLIDFSIALLAFASTFSNEVRLFPKRGLCQSSNDLRLLSL